MKIPIVYAINKNFEIPCLVSVLSAIENNKTDLEFHFVVPEKQNFQNLTLVSELKIRKCNYYSYEVNESLLETFHIGEVGQRRRGNLKQPADKSIFLKLFIADFVDQKSACVYRCRYLLLVIV